MMNIIEKLIAKNLTIGAVESFTGGGFSNHLTNISHASQVFKGGIVAYDPSIKNQVVGVDQKIIDTVGTISKECALELAKQGKERLKADIVVSFTGNAGPTASEDKPVGLVYIAFSYPSTTKVYELHLEGTRKQIKKQAIAFACQEIENYLGI